MVGGTVSWSMQAPWSCSSGRSWLVVVVVVDVDEAGFFGLLELATKMITMMTAAMTPMMTVLRIDLRRFFALASSARRISLAARWRARLSLGTGRDPIFPERACWIGAGIGRCPGRA